MENTPKKRPGRAARLSDYKTTSVSLPREQLEWATQQPGGLAKIVRECLEQRYSASQEGSSIGNGN